MGEEFHSPLRVVTDSSVLERTGIKKPQSSLMRIKGKNTGIILNFN